MSAIITAEHGVSKVDLVADGRVVATDFPDGRGPKNCQVAQTWTPQSLGMTVLSLLAFDQAGSSSHRLSIRLQVNAPDGCDSLADLRQPVKRAASVYTQYFFSLATLAAGASGGVVATCQAGSIVTGGGLHAYPDGELRVATSRKGSTGEASHSSASNTTGSSKTHHAYAGCLSGTGGSTSSISNLATVVPSGIGSAEPRCDTNRVG